MTMATFCGRHSHALSFDVEEHFQVSAFESPVRRRQWDQFESRVEQNVDRILTLLSERSIKATFFVLGWLAERHPRLVRKLATEGHEVASHGYEHLMITGQTPASFREDVKKAKGILESIIGAPVLGYRAPSFTITAATQWALPILVEEGYAYDSSIFPIMHDRYGMPDANPRCHQLTTPAGPLWEVPPSTLKVLGMQIPIAGGGYFRLYPYRILKWMLRQVEAQGHPLVMYFHPWEFDPHQPKMDGPMLSRFRHYLNLHKTFDRLRHLQNDFDFAPIRDLIHHVHHQATVGHDACVPAQTLVIGSR